MVGTDRVDLRLGRRLLVGLVLSLVVDEAIAEPTPPKTMRDAIVEPVIELDVAADERALLRRTEFDEARSARLIEADVQRSHAFQQAGEVHRQPFHRHRCDVLGRGLAARAAARNRRPRGRPRRR